ncbi:hypothetical protein [Nocardia sp. NPDC004260]
MPSIGARLLRTRWFVRAPIAVFRARLGFLFGGRLEEATSTAIDQVPTSLAWNS